MKELFFELIRVAIGTQLSLSRLPLASEWGELYKLAKKHSLVGVCFAALQRLGADADDGFVRIGMSEMLYFTWMGMAVKIQQKNELVNLQCAELQSKLSSENLSACVLKGQGIGQLYSEHLRNLRQSGDIDMWVKGGFDTVNEFVQRTCPSMDIAYHRFHYDVFEDTEVELHHRPTLMRNLFDNRKLQKWCDSFGEDSFVHLDLGFDVPSIEFNRIFILSHIYRHFLFEGVGLRQVMDYYFVLRESNKVDPEISKGSELSEADLLKVFRLTRFAGALMWVLKEKFGLEKEYLICKENEKEGRFLLNEIEQMGNFGLTDKRYEDQGKTMRFLKHWGHLLAHYPSEVVWSPIWIVYHRFWKRNHISKIYK